jgi:hypothetical protein
MENAINSADSTLRSIRLHRKCSFFISCATFQKDVSRWQVMGRVSFFQNDAYAGGAIMMGGTGRIRLGERVTFANNSASVAGAVLVYNTEETLQIYGHVLFLGNRCCLMLLMTK